MAFRTCSVCTPYVISVTIQIGRTKSNNRQARPGGRCLDPKPWPREYPARQKFLTPAATYTHTPCCTEYGAHISNLSSSPSDFATGRACVRILLLTRLPVRHTIPSLPTIRPTTYIRSNPRLPSPPPPPPLQHPALGRPQHARSAQHPQPTMAPGHRPNASLPPVPNNTPPAHPPSANRLCHLPIHHVLRVRPSLDTDPGRTLHLPPAQDAVQLARTRCLASPVDSDMRHGNLCVGYG